MTRRAAAWAAAFVLLLGAPAFAEWVVGVADGDTLTVERDEPATLDLPRQRPERVHRVGIDAPDGNSPSEGRPAGWSWN